MAAVDLSLDGRQRTTILWKGTSFQKALQEMAVVTAVPLRPWISCGGDSSLPGGDLGFERKPPIGWQNLESAGPG